MSTKTWNGSNNGDWSDQNDWSGGTVPGPSDDVVIDSGSVTLKSPSPDVTVNSLTLGSLGELTVQDNVALTASTTVSNAGTFTLELASLSDDSLTNTGFLSIQDATLTTSSFDNQGFTNIDVSSALLPDNTSAFGGSVVTINGTLTNEGYGRLTIGSANQNTATTVTATAVDNSTGLNLDGGTASGPGDLVKLEISSADGFGTAGEVTGSVFLSGDSLIEFDGGGGLTAIESGALLWLTGPNAVVANSSDTTTNSALTGLTSNAGTLQLQDESLTTTGDLNNTGFINIDISGGGSTFQVGGALINNHFITIGNQFLAAATNVTAQSLDNNGGNAFLILHGNTNEGEGGTTLDIASAAGFGTAGDLSGSVSLDGAALLEFASGSIGSIDGTGSLSIAGPGAFVADSSDTTTNSALTNLASNAGTLELADVSLPISGDFDNSGLMTVDYSIAATVDGSTIWGGSDIAINGTLTNEGGLIIGTANQNAATLVTAAAVDNSGLIELNGNTGSGDLVELEISSAAGFGTAGEITGAVELTGDSLVVFDGNGSFTGIESGATLSLDGPNAFLADAAATTDNSALSGLTSNAGSFDLQDEHLRTNGDLTNTGYINIDIAGGGGSSVHIGGALDNSRNIDIGNASSTAATTVTVQSLDNSGSAGASLSLHGNTTAASPGETTLDIESAAGFGTLGDVSGTVSLDGDSLLEFEGGGSITSIDGTGSLSISGPNAFVADSDASTTNSALTGIDSNAGAFEVADTLLSIGGDLDNSGSLTVDFNFSAFVDGASVWGGSDVTINGTLTNESAARVVIGSGNLNATTLVKAAAVDNSGQLIVNGNPVVQPGSLATLDIGSAAGFGTAGEVTGFVQVTGDAVIEFDGNGGLTDIESGATLWLDGPNAFVADASDNTENSALTGLSSNVGTLQLQDEALATSGDLNNTGIINIDISGGGGSTVQIGGVLDNSHNISIGNGALSVATSVTAQSLDNSGAISITGNAAFGASLTLDSGSSQDQGGTITINDGGELDVFSPVVLTVSGASTAINGEGTLDNAGRIVIDGSLTLSGQPTVGVSNIINDGTIEGAQGFSEIGAASDGVISGTGTLLVDAESSLEIAGAVSGNTVRFAADTGAAQIDNLLNNSDAQQFHAAISDFAAGDIIDLATAGLGTFGDITDATPGTYDAGLQTTVLSLEDNGNLVATLTLDGDYSGRNFGVSQGSNEVSISVAPCYCANTLILTTRGQKRVETLKIGDMVMTMSGVARPIKWIGRRSYAGSFVVGRKDILPVCIKAGALNDSVPGRDLWISPHHAMYLEGVLIEAKDLVDGVSIVQAERVETVEYFHIELERHDVIIAEGALSESFLDDDSRAMFHNAHEFSTLYPDAAVPSTRYCAPRLSEGYKVETARRHIALRARTYPSYKAISAGTLRGEIDGVNPRCVAGWAQNAEHPEAPVCLDIYAEGRVIGQVLANQYREDLKQAGYGSGRHSFEFMLPHSIAAESVEVRRSLDDVVLASPAIAAA